MIDPSAEHTEGTTDACKWGICDAKEENPPRMRRADDAGVLLYPPLNPAGALVEPMPFLCKCGGPVPSRPVRNSCIDAAAEERPSEVEVES